MQVKNILLLGSFALLGVSLMNFSKAKVMQAKEVFNKCRIKVQDIAIDSSNTKLSNFSFSIILRIENWTGQDFTLDTVGLIKAKIIRIYKGDRAISRASLDHFQNIEMKAGGAFETPRIYFTIDNVALLEILGEILTGKDFSLLDIAKLKDLKWSELKDTIKPADILKDFRYELEVEGLGETYTFKDKIL